MFDKTTRLVTENLARAIDRRSFLKRAGTTVFTGMVALASGNVSSALAVAGVKRQTAPPVPLQPVCSPPGPYCNTGGGILSGCHGSSCFQHLYNSQILQCRVYYIYQAGCWTTAASGGYWTCCDCECGSPRITTCGCAQFSGNPQPRPDTPRLGILNS